jgi:hypothetical protein
MNEIKKPRNRMKIDLGALMVPRSKSTIMFKSPITEEPETNTERLPPIAKKKLKVIQKRMVTDRTNTGSTTTMKQTKSRFLTKFEKKPSSHTHRHIESQVSVPEIPKEITIQDQISSSSSEAFEDQPYF